MGFSDAEAAFALLVDDIDGQLGNLLRLGLGILAGQVAQHFRAFELEGLIAGPVALPDHFPSAH